MLLEDERFSTCRLVLLHASYPFSREASYLASVYPQVHLDFGLAVPHLSFHGMVAAVSQLLELAPINKVMYALEKSVNYFTQRSGAIDLFEINFNICIVIKRSVKRCLDVPPYKLALLISYLVMKHGLFFLHNPCWCSNIIYQRSCSAQMAMHFLKHSS